MFQEQTLMYHCIYHHLGQWTDSIHIHSFKWYRQQQIPLAWCHFRQTLRLRLHSQQLLRDCCLEHSTHDHSINSRNKNPIIQALRSHGKDY